MYNLIDKMSFHNMFRNCGLRSKYRIGRQIDITMKTNTLHVATCRDTYKKCIIKSFAIGDSAHREIDHVTHLNDRGVKNIVEILEIAQNDDYIHVVIPQYEGGDWFESLIAHESFNRYEDVQALGQNLFETVHDCHQQGILHLDLKPENICFHSDKKTFSIIDFEASCVSNLKKINYIVGTENYVAPETLNGHVSALSDAWSLGATLFSIKTKDVHHNNMDTLKKSNPHRLRDSFADLCARLLTVSLDDRLSVENALRHDFFQDTNT